MRFLKKEKLYSFLSYFLDALSHGKKRILVSCILGVLLAASISYFIPPIYMSYSQIYLGGMENKNAFINDYETLQEYLGYQYEAIKGKDVLKNVEKKLHLDMDKAFAKGNAKEILKKMIKVEHSKGTNLILVKVFSSNPVMSSSIAKAIAEEYAALTKENNFNLTKDAFNWLTKISSFSRKIRMYDKALYEASKKNNAGEIELEQLSIKNNLKSLANEKANYQSQHDMLKRDTNYKKKLLEEKDISTLISLYKTEDNVYYFKRKRGEIRNKLYEIENSQNTEYEEIENLKKDLEYLEQSLLNFIRNDIARKENIQEKWQENIKEIDRNIKENDKEEIKLSQKRNQIEALKRKRDIYYTLYSKALSELESGDISVVSIKGINTPNLDIVPETVFPNMVLNSFLGLVLGFLYGVYLQYKKDKTIAIKGK